MAVKRKSIAIGRAAKDRSIELRNSHVPPPLVRNYHRSNIRLLRTSDSFVEMYSTPPSMIHHTPSFNCDEVSIRLMSFAEKFNTLPFGYVIVRCSSVPLSPVI